MRTLRRPIGAESRVFSDRAVHPFDVFQGTEGNDTYKGTGTDDTINGLGGDDTLSGGDGGDLINGGDGDDILAGDAGDDILNGGSGDDIITSIAGADTVDGGDGVDQWTGSYADTTVALTFDQRAGTLSNGTTLAGIEAIRLTTGSGGDRFTMNGDQTFAIFAGAGLDTLVFDPTGTSRSAEPLSIQIDVQGQAFNLTVGDGNGTSRANGVEYLTVVGSSSDDTFAVGPGDFKKDAEYAISLDGGGGRDRLGWDFSYLVGATFVAHRNGTVDTNVGTAVNFEIFDLIVGYGAKVILGDGDDTVQTGAASTIKTGAGNDTIVAFGDSVTLSGGAGADTITTSGNRAIVFGNSGDDVIKTSGEDTLVDGGLGFDSWSTTLYKNVDYNQALDKFSNGTTLRNVERVAFITSVYGQDSNFYLSRASDLTITSRNISDRFVIDLATVSGAVDFVITVDDRKNGYLAFGDTQITALSHRHQNYPDVTISATSFDDSVTLTNRSANLFVSTIDGGEGFDTLRLQLASNSRFDVAEDGTITSSFGHYASFEQFDITAFSGANTITLGGGDDHIFVVLSSTDANVLSGGGGMDRIEASSGADRLLGGDGDDQLFAGGGDDTVNGGAGNDLLDGGAGDDIAGYDGAASGVTVAIMAGAQDTGGAGIDTLVGIENLYGSDFDDTLTGDGVANMLRGRAGDDVLSGGGGDDRIEGATGADRITGGSGADTFAFMKLVDISVGAPDQILDFSHADGDRIELSNIDLSKDPGDQQFTFIGTSAFTGDDVLFELRVQDNGNGNYLVQGDLDHDGKADFTFAVKTDGPLVAADFLL